MLLGWVSWFWIPLQSGLKGSTRRLSLTGSTGLLAELGCCWTQGRSPRALVRGLPIPGQAGLSEGPAACMLAGRPGPSSFSLSGHLKKLPAESCVGLGGWGGVCASAPFPAPVWADRGGSVSARLLLGQHLVHGGRLVFRLGPRRAACCHPLPQRAVLATDQGKGRRWKEFRLERSSDWKKCPVHR